MNCKFRSYIKPWWCVLHEKLCFYNNKIILVFKIHLYLFKIEVDFDFEKCRRFYKINDICSRITPEQQLALIFFFTFTGCDITSSFFDISKSTWWNVWCQNACITKAFTKLSWAPDKVEENDLSLIEKYVYTAYDPHNCFHMNDINRLRLLLFTKSSENKLRKLPPTREALQLHILQSVYAAGWIWGVTLQPSDQIPSLVEWRWKYSKSHSTWQLHEQ